MLGPRVTSSSGFNECMIAYLLAMASPTHPIPADCYYLGWAGNVQRYVNGKTYYGIQQPVGARLADRCSSRITRTSGSTLASSPTPTPITTTITAPSR